MSYNITLNSTNVVQGTFNNTYQYTFKNGAFDIPEGSQMCISQVTIPYSWINVSAALGNNVIGYVLPVGTTTTTLQYFSFILPDGFYTASQLNDYLHEYMLTKGHYWYVNGVLGSTTYYPISIETYPSTYTSKITSIILPLKSASSGYYDMANIFGTGASAGSWLTNGTGTAGYPQDTNLQSGQNYACLYIPQTINTTSSIGYMLGFTGANSVPTSSAGSIVNPSPTSSSTPALGNGTFYPTANGFLTTVTKIAYGNSLTSSPSFVPMGSSVNGVIARCNLVENAITNNTDILDSFPITTTYGSNLNFEPQMEHWVKLRAGRYNNITVYFQDQNLNPLIMLDNNVLITLFIKFPEKK